MATVTVSFDRVARPYRWLEYMSFGPWLSRCRNAQLAHLVSARHALVLGDGDGRFLAHLLTANPLVTADVVDSSESMLRLLEHRIGRLGTEARRRICLHHADALAWSPGEHYDLVVSHFFLDCFFPAQVRSLVGRLRPRIAPGARWVVSEFAIPSDGVAAHAARGIVCLLYRAFGWLTGLRVRQLPDYADALERHGLRLNRERQFLGGLLRSQLWELCAISSAPVTE